MYEINYQRAASLENAASMIDQGTDPKVLAGGQTLIPTLKQRLANPSDVIDIGRIAGLDAIKETDGAVEIGAMATHAAVAGSPLVQGRLPGLAALAGHIGDPHVRHMGTIGGSIANNDPAADYPAALLALNAQIVTTARRIGADEFFTGLFETMLEENEIISAVHIRPLAQAAYAKFPNPASRYALVGVFVARHEDGQVRVAVTGAGADGVFRAAAFENALQGRFEAAALDGLAVEAGDLVSDIHASAEYRAHLIGVMTRRALHTIQNG